MASVQTSANEVELPAAEGLAPPEGAPVQPASNGLGVWTCAFCTWQNADVPPMNTKCDACEKPRDASPDSDEESPDSAEDGSEGMDLKENATTWACAACTFWNEPNAEACAMCAVVPGFVDGSAPGGVQEAVDGVDGGASLNKTVSCEACTASKVCEACQSQPGADGGAQLEKGSPEQSSGQGAQGPAGGQSEEGMHTQEDGVKEQKAEAEVAAVPEKAAEDIPEPVRWSCQVCTFENQEPDNRCQVCTSPRPAEGGNPEEACAASQNMCALCGLIKPFGQPWKGGLCSQCRPVVEEDNEMVVEAVPDVPVGLSWSVPEAGPCGVCQKVVPGVLLQVVHGCGHQACCACLASLVHTRMEAAPPASAASHADVLSLLGCLEAGCPHLLSSGSLSRSLPPPSFLAVSHWLVTALSGLYAKPAAAITGNPSPEPQVTCLAPDCPAHGVPQTFVQTVKGDPSSRMWAVCPACPHVTCLACGAVTGVCSADEYRDHRFSCALAQTWDVFQALLALEEAFQTNEAAGGQSADDTEERSHKKQKTEAAGSSKRKIVWAKGTGFGGGGRYDEDEEEAYDESDEEEEHELEAEDEIEDEIEEDDDDEGEPNWAEEFEQGAIAELQGPPEVSADMDSDPQELAAMLAAEAAMVTAGGHEEGPGREHKAGASGAGAEAAKEETMEVKEETMEDAALSKDQPNNGGGEQAGQPMPATVEAAVPDGVAGISPVTPSVGEAGSLPWATSGSPPVAAGSPSSGLPTNTAAEAPAASAGVALQGAEGGTQTAAANEGMPSPVVPQPTELNPSTGNLLPGALPGTVPPMPAGNGASPAVMVPPPGMFVPPSMAGKGPSADKRKERKDKEEARQEKLREAERQADIRLALAAEALTEALQGNDFAVPPHAATAALVLCSCAGGILAAVLQRCSLLDVGHRPEREQLHLTLLHLVRALAAHADLLPALLADTTHAQNHHDHMPPSPQHAATSSGADRKRGKGLLGAVLAAVSRALPKQRKQEGEAPSTSAEVSMLDAPGVADTAEERGIRADPALASAPIVLEEGRSVLAALADLNRQARVVQQGLKHGMAEGEGEGDCGVGIVGLVLEVSDCYEHTSARAAAWDGRRKQAQEEREAATALEESAREAEGLTTANGNQETEAKVAGEGDGPTQDNEKEAVGSADGPTQMEVDGPPPAQLSEQQTEEEGPSDGGPEKAACGAAESGAEASDVAKAHGKTPLKERVMKGLKGMLISRKNGKQKEEPAETAATSGGAQADMEDGPKTPDIGAEGRTGGPALEERMRAYKAALKAVQFQEVSLVGEDGQYEHSYRGEVGSAYGEQSGSGAHSAKRQLRVLREIAALATTLPLEWESSVHIRVDTCRMDLLKAAIIGPQDTPYSNGIWLFDVLLPPDYPERPPKVHFLTTGGGTVRFNPNLYNCGKVCLSLLGTWSGPSWRPGHSTLLQVLISLQSLVFVAEPYYNEPGYEARESSAQSEAYNQAVRLNALKYAILAPLQAPSRAFRDVTQQHFKLKRTEVAAQVDDWIRRADSQHKNACLQVGTQIKEELNKLGD